MADLKKLAEEIVGLTLLEAQELKTILKDEYGIEPAAGGAVMMAGPAAGGDAGGGAAEEEKTEFDVILKSTPAPRRSTSSRKSAPSPAWASRKPRSWSKPAARPSRKPRQGRSRRDQEEARSSWRRGRAEVIGAPGGLPRGLTNMAGSGKTGPAETCLWGACARGFPWRARFRAREPGRGTATGMDRTATDDGGAPSPPRHVRET
jgi:hypothetical protein